MSEPTAPPPSYDEVVKDGNQPPLPYGAAPPYPPANTSHPPYPVQGGYPGSQPTAGIQAPYPPAGGYPPNQYTYPVTSGGFNQPANYNQPSYNNQTGQYTYNTVTVNPNLMTQDSELMAQQRRKRIMLVIFLVVFIAILISVMSAILRT